MAFEAITRAIPDLQIRIQTLANNERWPLWLRKSQISLTVLRYAEIATVEQAVSAWRQNFGEEHDSAELWLTAASVLRLEYTRDEKDRTIRLQILGEILQRPWSKEALKLSTQYLEINVMIRQQIKSNDLFEYVKRMLDSSENKDSNVLSLVESVRAALNRLMANRESSIGKDTGP